MQFLALLTVEDNNRVKRPISIGDYQTHYLTFLTICQIDIILSFFESRPEINIRRWWLEGFVPRLAQLARAPDCRLETHGCRQPSGGPRFKSGSADQKIIIHSVDGCIRSILGGSVRIVYSAICVEILDFNRCR